MTDAQKTLADLDMRTRRTDGCWRIEVRALDLVEVGEPGGTYAETAAALLARVRPTAEAMQQFRGSLMAHAVRTLERLEALCEALGGAA